MENLCFGRQLRQKLQVLFLLAVCAWLVFQIKLCINNRTDNSFGETKLVEEEFVLDGTLEAKDEHHKEQGNSNYPKTPSVDDLQINSNGSINSKVSEEEETQMQENGVESTNVVGINGRIQVFQSFQDENGVPPDDIIMRMNQLFSSARF